MRRRGSTEAFGPVHYFGSWIQAGVLVHDYTAYHTGRLFGFLAHCIARSLDAFLGGVFLHGAFEEFSFRHGRRRCTVRGR
jgi:hypothetical protein